MLCFFRQTASRERSGVGGILPAAELLRSRSERKPRSVAVPTASSTTVARTTPLQHARFAFTARCCGHAVTYIRFIQQRPASTRRPVSLTTAWRGLNTTASKECTSTRRPFCNRLRASQPLSNSRLLRYVQSVLVFYRTSVGFCCINFL